MPLPPGQNLPQAPPQPPVQPTENVIPADMGGGGGKVALVAIVVAIIVGAIAAAATYYFMNASLQEVTSEKSGLEQRLASTEAELITTKTALAELEQSQEELLPFESNIGEYLVSVSKEEDGFQIVKDSLKVATVPYVGEDSNFEAMGLWRVTANNAYFVHCPEEVGGYILYEFCNLGFYRLDLVTDELIKIELPDLSVVFDLSPGESQILYRTHNGQAIILKDLLLDTEISFPVQEEYSTFGNAIFSPDGTRFAYAAAVGDPNDESSVAYIVNIKSQQQEEIKRMADSAIHVHFWESNEFVLID